MKLENVKIVNHNKIISNADVEIEGKLITKITVKKGEGTRFLIPGLIDTHVHGFYGHDFMDSQESVKTICQALLKKGITGVVPTIMTATKEKLLESLKNISNEAKANSQILGAHLEGPYISHAKKGAHNSELLLKPNGHDIINFQKESNNILRKISYAPEEAKDLEKYIKVLLDNNIVPTIGHTNASFDIATKAIELGSTSCTHLWNAMSGVANRSQGTVTAILMNDKLCAELICDLIHVDEQTIKLTINNKGKYGIMLVSDSIRPGGLDDGEYESGGLKITKVGAKITLKDTDTIAGSASSIFYGFKNLLKMGVKIEDAVAMTSFNAANNLGIKDIGVIAENMKANIILLDNDYNIENVIFEGEKI